MSVRTANLKRAWALPAVSTVDDVLHPNKKSKPAIGATTTKDGPRERHDDIILNAVLDPVVLPSYNRYYRVRASNKKIYRGVFPDIDFQGCFFAFRLCLSVKSEKNNTFFVGTRDKALSIQRLPFTYALLERIYRVYVEKVELRRVSEDEASARLFAIFQRLMALDFVRPYLLPNATSHNLRYLTEHVNDSNYSMEQLSKIAQLRPLVFDPRILDNDAELLQLHTHSDYFTFEQGNDDHIFFIAYGEGYEILYPPRVLDPMRDLIHSQPWNCYFASTKPPVVERFQFNVGRNCRERTVALSMPTAERLLVVAYEQFIVALSGHIHSGSDGLPTRQIVMNAECKTELLRRGILVETEAPSQENGATAEMYLYDGYCYRAQQYLLQLFEELLVRIPITWPGVEIPDAFDIHQQEFALSLRVTSMILLTGGPGFGKTMSLATLLALYAETGKKILILVPTGKNMDVIIDAIKPLHDAEASNWQIDTQPNVSFVKTNQKYLHTQQGCIVVRTMQSVAYDCGLEGYTGIDAFHMIGFDESSMLGIVAAYNVLRLFDWNKVERVLLAGDKDQCPPVKDAALYPQLYGLIPSVELKIMHRATSDLFRRNLEKLRQGSLDFEFDDDSWILAEPAIGSKAYDTVVECHRRFDLPIEKTMVTTPYNDDVDNLRKVLFAHHFPEFAAQKDSIKCFYPGEIIVFMAKIKDEECRLVRRSERKILFIEKCVGVKDLSTGELILDQNQKITKQDLSAYRKSPGHRLVWASEPRLTSTNWHLCRLHLSRDDTLHLLNVPHTAIERGTAGTVQGVQGGQADTVIFYQSRMPEYLSLMVELSVIYTGMSRARNRLIFNGSLQLLQEQLDQAKDKKRKYWTFRSRLAERLRRLATTLPDRMVVPLTLSTIQSN